VEASYQRQRASPPRRRLTVTSAVPNAAAGSRRLLEVASGPTNRIQTIEHRLFIRSLSNRSLLRRSKLELDGVSRSNDKISPNLVGPNRLPLESLMCTFHPVLCRLLAFATVNVGLGVPDQRIVLLPRARHFGGTNGTSCARLAADPCRCFGSQMAPPGSAAGRPEGRQVAYQSQFTTPRTGPTLDKHGSSLS